MTESNCNFILRIAIIGAGPAGFYAAQHLFKKYSSPVHIDMFDKLPTPHGLVRLGVAPDHQKTKSVSKVYDKIASNPNFRFFGYVEFGKDINLDDLKQHYHQIIFATGAQTDRNLRIPGIESNGSHSASEFVAWYNGHPDYKDRNFNLSHKGVAIVGVGNVAVDVARILCRTREELEKTDIADHALEVLSRSKIKHIHILGRRGPLQAAFTNPELKELGQMEDADTFTFKEEIEVDQDTRKKLIESNDHSTIRKIDILTEYSRVRNATKSRRIDLRFLVSPVEIIDDGRGNVKSLKIVKNKLVSDKNGNIRAEPTDKFDYLEIGLVFRSIGYSGVPLEGIPYDESNGTVFHEKGRILEPDSRKHITGFYATGWIKRGPTGVIGTNKSDSLESVNCMIEDLNRNKYLDPKYPEISKVEDFLAERKPEFIDYESWLEIDREEINRGKSQGRPRVKYTTIQDLLNKSKKIMK